MYKNLKNVYNIGSLIKQMTLVHSEKILDTFSK